MEQRPSRLPVVNGVPVTTPPPCGEELGSSLRLLLQAKLPEMFVEAAVRGVHTVFEFRRRDRRQR